MRPRTRGRRLRSRKPRRGALSIDELAIWLDGNRRLAEDLMRILRLPLYATRRPAVEISRVRAWERRQQHRVGP